MSVRYYQELLNYCARNLKDRETAADLVQEAYARLLSMAMDGQSITDSRALLYRVARNLMTDDHRRAVLRDHDSLDAMREDELPLAGSAMQPEEIYALNRYVQALVAAIESLPPRCREAFILNRFDGLSHQEVADHMGISRNMVAQHIIRGVLVCKACHDLHRGV